MSFPIRSPRAEIGGVVILGRVIDKIRLHAAGRLPAGYHVGFVEGNRTFDDRVCRFLNVDFDALTQRVLDGGTDEEILEWCYANGRKPDAEQLEIWNTFMKKRGWNDPASPGLEKSKQASGLGDRADLVTFFDLMDVEEGRAP